MNSQISKLHFFWWLLFTIQILNGQQTLSPEEKAKKIINANKQSLKHTDQLLIVFNTADADYHSQLMALEKKGANWQMKFSLIKASIGQNGFAKPGEKKELDGKTPTGIFDLGQLFSYENAINTLLPFIQSTKEDKWIDDTTSNQYNQYVRGQTDAKSFENLIFPGIDYKYCMVIEYNTHPVIKGKGSAIFFHLVNDTYSPTLGCVAISEADMKSVLQWLKPNLKKNILMGNETILLKGL
jgi:L,D-peptidoglycan transpeptidase YkuD (ErfK/YbiS/YcfS/YnhG family)